MNTLSLTECEVVVMKAIWEADHKLSLQEILAEVNGRFGKNWKPQTVSTFLTRLVKKEFLSMKRQGRTFLYTPLVEETEYGKQEISRCASLWYHNDAALFLSALSSQRKLTAGEIKKIRKLLDKQN